MLTKRFSFIGEVLDIGFHMDGKAVFGQGYVMINLKLTKTEVTEELSRILPWPEENRQLLLTWDEMPPYRFYWGFHLLLRAANKTHLIKIDCLMTIKIAMYILHSMQHSCIIKPVSKTFLIPLKNDTKAYQ
jgi:hypothetical protein